MQTPDTYAFECQLKPENDTPSGKSVSAKSFLDPAQNSFSILLVAFLNEGWVFF